VIWSRIVCFLLGHDVHVIHATVPNLWERLGICEPPTPFACFRCWTFFDDYTGLHKSKRQGGDE